MNSQQWLRRVVALAAAAVAGVALAQTPAASDVSCPRTRAEVRDECIAFVKTHRWDEASGAWVTKSGGKASSKVPEGVSTRVQIRAERDAFLKKNTWNEAAGRWEPVGAPRDVAKLSREEVKRETRAFMRTHEWDENAGAYVEKRGK